MAIDMSTVKEIEFNNKQVKKIEDNNGNILWQKKSATPVTITLTNLKYIDLYNTYWYNDRPFIVKDEVFYTHLNYINIKNVSDDRDTDAFILLPLSTYQNIKNKSYTADTTITGINAFSTISGQNVYCICYVENNELYCVGSMEGVNDGPVWYSSDTTGFTYTYVSLSWYVQGNREAKALYGSNNLYLTTPSDSRVVRNTNSPTSSINYGSTNGGVTPKLRDASGTMTLQYTI